MNSSEFLPERANFKEISLDDEGRINEKLRKIGILSNFTCFPQLYVYLSQPGAKLFLVSLIDGSERLILHRKNGDISDVRILFEKTGNDNELIELLKIKFSPDYLAYNIIPATPVKLGDDEAAAIRNDLIIDVKTVAELADLNLRRDFDKCQKNHPNLVYREVGQDDREAIDAFFKEWSLQTSHATENARRFIENYLGKDQARGSAVFDENKIVGLCFHSPHPVDHLVATNIILQNLRGYHRLGEWLSVKHAEQLQNEGYKKALIGGTEAPSKTHFKNKFMLNGSINTFYSEEVFKNRSVLFSENNLRDIWLPLETYNQLLQSKSNELDHAYAADINQSKFDEFGDLEKWSYFPSVNQLFSKTFSEEKDSKKRSLYAFLFLKDFDILIPENQSVFLRSLIELEEITEITPEGPVFHQANELISALAVKEISKEKLDAKSLTQNVLNRLAEGSENSQESSFASIIIEILLKIKDQKSSFYREKVKGKLDEQVFSDNINSIIQTLSSGDSEQIIHLIRFIPALVYYFRHPQELIFLSGFSEQWLKLGLENLCLVGGNLAETFSRSFAEIALEDVLRQLSLNDLSREFPGIEEKLSNLDNIKDQLSISQSETHFLFVVKFEERQKTVIVSKNETQLVGAALEQCLFFYENAKYDYNFSNNNQVQLIASSIKSNSGGQVLGQSIADYGFVTTTGALKYANTPDGRMEHERHERWHLMAFKRWPHLRIMSILPEVLEGIPYAYFDRVDPKMLLLDSEEKTLFEELKDLGFWDPRLKGAKYSYAFVIWKYFDSEMKKMGFADPLILILDKMEELMSQKVGYVSENLILNDFEESVEMVRQRFVDLYRAAIEEVFKEFSIEHGVLTRYKNLIKHALEGAEEYFFTVESRIKSLFGNKVVL